MIFVHDAIIGYLHFFLAPLAFTPTADTAAEVAGVVIEAPGKFQLTEVVVVILGSGYKGLPVLPIEVKHSEFWQDKSKRVSEKKIRAK